ncbi:T9SS type A sorting domain-containing protein [bacterium]|nr:T9SS type A sorting domain-containing protein [bacterium]MBU1637925.1 T9SS type A sorting domain-containing protein [bacterium]MBU1921217.1 T9SS type A sorting domain-containing protein [bacterium]RQW00272.1 MAG: T9SS C-terminal target domain-containing protein [bacterium]
MKILKSILLGAIVLTFACTGFAQNPEMIVAFNSVTQQMNCIIWSTEVDSYGEKIPFDVMIEFYCNGSEVPMNAAMIQQYVFNPEATDPSQCYQQGNSALNVTRHACFATLSCEGLTAGDPYHFEAHAQIVGTPVTLIREDELMVTGEGGLAGYGLDYDGGCPGEELPDEIGIGQSYCATICHQSLFIPIYCEDPGYTPDLMEITVENGCDIDTECGSSTCDPLDDFELFDAVALIFPGCNLYLHITYCGLDAGCICITRGDFYLPVERGEFNAVAGDNNVALNWNTASETNVDEFIVTRNGEEVKRVEALNSATGAGYGWVDNSVVNGTDYSYTLTVRDLDGSELIWGTVNATPAENIVTGYSLAQNFPNPFNSETSFTYTIPEAEYVSLSIHNLLGQEIATLVNSQMEAGTHTLNWTADGLAAGVYMYTLNAGNFSQTNKMLYLK